MTFQECCVYCAGNTELVKEFNRLSGHKMGEKRAPIEKVIDEACGHDPHLEAFPDFISFIYECIWLPLIERTGDI